MVDDPSEAADGVSLVLSERRNRLRKLPYTELADLPDYMSEEVQFRHRRVWIIVLKRRDQGGRLVCAMRAHMHPFVTTRLVWFGGFVKNPDDTWVSEGIQADPVFLELRKELESVPLV